MTAKPKDNPRRNCIGLSNAARRMAVLTLFAPFLLLSLFSNGTMLLRTADDQLTVVICTGTEQVEMIWGPDGSLTPAEKSPAPDHDDKTQCDWQIASQSALAAQPAIIPPTDAVFATNHLGIGPPFHARRINVLASSARGPPRQI